jgi:hypothetical protein
MRLPGYSFFVTNFHVILGHIADKEVAPLDFVAAGPPQVFTTGWDCTECAAGVQ